MPHIAVGMHTRPAAAPVSRPVSCCRVNGGASPLPGFLRPVSRRHCRQSLSAHRQRIRRPNMPAGCSASQRQQQQAVQASAVLEAPQASSAADVEAFLDQPLQTSPALKLGQLKNGLRYVILPNKVPPNRFEAHLEMHVGAVEEEANQQGLAHVVEHVTFLGSKKRERLLGTGARSNAYTDFHHTVFHVHSPLHNAGTGQPLLPQVLEALTEIAFEPEMLPSRLEKERRAVLAEAQMMNTIEYRVDCQLLTNLHAENLLGSRFPIGSTDQVKKWDIHALREFWQRWYFPANATLYIVGDLNMTTEELEAQIEKYFGPVPAGRMPGPGQKPYGERMRQLRSASSAGNGNEASVAWSAADAIRDGEGEYKQRLARIPNVKHVWGDGPLQPDEKPVVAVFRHRLLQQFMLSIFSKRPVRPVTTMRDLREQLATRIVLCVLHFRLGARYVAADPPFTSIEMDHSDSGREGCSVSTLTILSEPCDWRGAVQVAVQEVRRLMQFGVTAGEMERYKAALLRDSEQMASQGDSIASLDNLNFVMEYLALGHTFMNPHTNHESNMAMAETVTVEEVNKVARSLLAYVGHFGKELEAIEAAAAHPEQWLHWGASRTTSIVACIPAFTTQDGHSTGGGAPAVRRGGGMVTSEHVPTSASLTEIDAEVDAAVDGLVAGEDPDASQLPDGAVSFELEADEITGLMAEDSASLEAQADVDVPADLISEEKVQQLMAERQPHFVPVGDATAVSTAADPATGVVQLKLSNGISVNFRHSSNEPQAAMLRMVAGGGRSCEGSGAAPGGTGVVVIGTRTLNESGRIGEWQRPQIELFCISKLINCVMEADEEFTCMDLHFAVGSGGLASVCQMVHLFLEAPVWEEAAMERSKALYTSHYRGLPKSLERSTADRIMAAMLGDDRRFRDPNTEEIEALRLENMRKVIMSQLRPDNLEISIVGDLSVEEVEPEVLRYLGTVSPREPDPSLPPQRPIQMLSPPPDIRHQQWHLQDSDERAVAYIAGAAPSKWSTFSSPRQPLLAGQQIVPPPRPAPMASLSELASAAVIRRAHPLYGTVTLALLTEIVNSRLFTTVRDTLGLTYDVNFDLSLLDRLNVGWFVVNVTSTPQKIQEALQASVGVLRTLRTQRITVRELARAQRTLLTRHESDTKDNAFWLRQLTHLQNAQVPYKRLECLRDVVKCFEAAAVEDLYDALSCFSLDDSSLFTVVGTSGQSPPPPPALLKKPDAGHFQAFAEAAKKVQSAAGIVKMMQAADRFKTQ